MAEEIKTIEQSIWGKIFDEMYGKLADKDKAVNVAKFYSKED